MKDIDIDNIDFYEHDKPENEQRTKQRLSEMIECGLKEVGVADFGFPGITSGLYIEYVWHKTAAEWQSYMEYTKGVIAKRTATA